MTHPLRHFLEAVGTALQSDPMQARVMGSWDDPTSRPTVRIAPSATPAQIKALNETIGGPMPESLREVLQEVSARIEIAWVLRGRYVKADWGGQTVETEVTPPDALLEWNRGLNADGTAPEGAKRTPRFISGAIRFDLNSIAAAIAGVDGWQSVYADAEGLDADTRAHFALIRDFMGAGLPVMTAPNGDWMAIDQRDATECLLHVSHEGEDAGIEIDLTLPQFLAHQAWLGPVWCDFPQVYQFSDKVEDVIPGDHRVTEAHFSALSEQGRIWRDWFWQGSGLADPDPSLLIRCDPPTS